MTKTSAPKRVHIRATKDAIFDLLLRIFSSLARVRSVIKPRRDKQAIVVENLPVFRHLVLQPAGDDVVQWKAIWESPRESDVRTILLGDAPKVQTQGVKISNDVRAVLKVAVSERGAAAVERHIAQLRDLRRDVRLSEHMTIIPEILAIERSQGFVCVVESAMPGEDGRLTMQSVSKRPDATVAALRAIAALHRLTASDLILGDDWLARWIDAPIEILREPVVALMSSSNRGKALLAFREEQRQFWQGRRIALGVGHGDLAPGNVLFSSSGGLSSPQSDFTSAINVNAIIDWERGTDDAPAGFDAAHLFLTMRAQLGGGELGHIVKQMILDPAWSRNEKAWLDAAYSDDFEIRNWLKERATTRALCGLAWLHHVVANLQKSDDYRRNRLWLAANIERVLQIF